VNDLGEQIFETVKDHLKANGMAQKQGTIFDATIIEAPSSTKNEKRERDPEMHQTTKGNQWHFGMKDHLGVDSESGLIHSLETTAANGHDLTPAADLLHGSEETVVDADAGYQGIEKRPEMQGRGIGFRTSMRPGQRRALPDTSEGRLDDLIETAKAPIRACLSVLREMGLFNLLDVRCERLGVRVGGKDAAIRRLPGWLCARSPQGSAVNH
jgi:IS5 family transposase